MFAITFLHRFTKVIAGQNYSCLVFPQHRSGVDSERCELIGQVAHEGMADDAGFVLWLWRYGRRPLTTPAPVSERTWPRIESMAAPLQAFRSLGRLIHLDTQKQNLEAYRSIIVIPILLAVVEGQRCCGSLSHHASTCINMHHASLRYIGSLSVTLRPPRSDPSHPNFCQAVSGRRRGAEGGGSTVTQ